MIEEIPKPDDFDSYSSSSKNVDSVITGIAIIHVITGLVSVPLVFTIFSFPIIQAPLEIIFIMMVEGVILAATIPLYIVIGIAIWLVKTWAWKVSVISNILCLIFNIFGGVVLTAILNIVILLALNNADVKFALQSKSIVMNTEVVEV